MIIGVISEGHSDRAVIKNILIGLTGLDSSDIIPIRPEYSKDETDKAKDANTFSNWSLVKQECEERDKMEGFLALEDHDFVVIHLDTAEADLYGIKRPGKKGSNYASKLRALAINKIDSWLNVDMSRSLLYAVAVEETEAWILPIYLQRDSSQSVDPKKNLARILSQKGLDSSITYGNYLELSKDLSKKKKVEKLLKYNSSLKEFYQEIIDKVLPKIT